MDKIVNWAILREPLNWLTVWTVLAIAALAYTAIMRHPAAQISVNQG